MLAKKFQHNSAPKLITKVVASYPELAQQRFFEIRHILLSTAMDNPQVGKLQETLKWGEPAYLTSQTKTGTTIRVAWKAKHPEYIGIYFNCRTSLVATIKDLFPNDFRFEGSRGLLLKLDKFPVNTLSYCFEMALLYHIKKQKKGG